MSYTFRVYSEQRCTMPIRRPEALLAARFIIALSLLVTFRAAADPPPTRMDFHDSAGAMALTATAYLRGDVESTWKVITDPSAGASLFDSIVSIKSSGKNIWNYALSSPIGEKEIRCSVAMNRSARSVTWKRISGSLVRFEGRFQVDDAPDYPGHVKVTYLSIIDPGVIGRLLMTKNRRREMAKTMFPRLQRLILRSDP